MVKKRKYRGLIVFALISFCILTGTVKSYAEIPYKTYTYDFFRKSVDSPHAYIPENIVYSSEIVDGGLKEATQLYVDRNNYIYISDTGNNRVLKLDANLKLIKKYEFFENSEVKGDKDSFKRPMGVFVNEKNEIYITDSENSRIVILDENSKLIKVISAPKTDLLPKEVIFKPTAVSVDKSGRIYVIAKTCNLGIIAMSADGEFEGFIGAQKVSPDFNWFWRKYLMTDEQKRRVVKFVPTEYNNLEIDEYGFLYVTINTIKEENLVNAMRKRKIKPDGGEEKFAPVKRLNPTGSDVLTRNGFFIPGGDVDVMTSSHTGDKKDGPSSIIDIALKENGIYSLLDCKRNRIFTYDDEGRLLYAFAGTGIQKGLFTKATSLAYVGSDLLVFDQNKNSITIFKRTKYGELLDQAIELYKDRKYDEAYNLWENLYKYNANNELIYMNKGRVLLRQEKFKDAMECFKHAYDIENYSKAFKLYRKDVMKKFILIIPIGFIILIYLVLRFFKYAKKNNNEAISRINHLSLKDELLYSFHYIFHPFDGAYDLKHEKRGSVRTSIIIIALVLFAKIFNVSITGFIFNPFQIYLEYGMRDEIVKLLASLLLWCIANWCLTTLMEGEGRFKDIFIVTSYSLMPMVLLLIPSAIISNFLTLEQGSLINFLNSFAIAWSLFLILVGAMITHQYTMTKNIVTSICSVVGMAFIVFLGVLFTVTTNKLVTFIVNIYKEVVYRL